MHLTPVLALLLISITVGHARVCPTGSTDCRKTICLNMIVKNEKDVIRRCLDSVIPIIDYWVIVDTGSTDGTQQIIREHMLQRGVKGELHERPWKNFEHNRNEALNLTRGKADYVFLMDADEYVSYEEGFKLPPLDKDYYYMNLRSGSFRWSRVLLFNNHLKWNWVGVLHEVLDTPVGASEGRIENAHVVCTTEGARAKDPEKYIKDAKLLEEGLKAEPHNSRYVFYLAQSYADAGNFPLALLNYQKRVAMGGWDQELFISYVRMGGLHERLGSNMDTIIACYKNATDQRKLRVEPYYHMAHYFRRHNLYEKCYQVAKIPSVKSTTDVLFVDEWMYDYGLLVELSVCAFWSGKYKECKDISMQLLAKTDLPTDVRDVVQQNLGFSYQKLLERVLQLPAVSQQGSIGDTVLLAILAHNKAHILPRYLKCIENQDYPKELIIIYIYTNNNDDNTLQILDEWSDQHKHSYKDIIFEPSTVNSHGKSSEMVFARTRSLQKATERKTKYYFVVDCDNFIAPSTLSDLVGKGKPIVAPLLRSIPERNDLYSNFFAAVTSTGYFQQDPLYNKIVSREKVGLFKVPVVHGTYLIKSSVINQLSYTDGTKDFDFIIFSRSARANAIDQFITNEKEYGTLIHFFDKISLDEEKSRLKAILTLP